MTNLFSLMCSPFCRVAAYALPGLQTQITAGPGAAETADAGRSPGVQGAAATGRPLCAPCAMRDITQKTNRERNVR
ncbi:DNA helicase [Klebsiella sp. H-Nf2]|nr:DNA helicase [Klebsiella sp. H-Nf2]PJX53012.1 DNA helicase [Klebsiella sp. D-Nf1]